MIYCGLKVVIGIVGAGDAAKYVADRTLVTTTPLALGGLYLCQSLYMSAPVNPARGIPAQSEAGPLLELRDVFIFMRGCY